MQAYTTKQVTQKHSYEQIDMPFTQDFVLSFKSL